VQNVQRLDSVMRALWGARAESVLDLGCGPGPLLLRLAQAAQVTRIVGLDHDAGELAAARRALAPLGLPDGDRLRLVESDLTAPPAGLAGFDAAVLVETIEHVEPARLSALDHAVFKTLRPETVVVTTPNREFNALWGRDDRQRRHPDHRFEWTRAEFRAWATGVAARRGYAAELHHVGPPHPRLGSSSQMAVFARVRPPSAPPAHLPRRRG
jgi:3' terminal RNA ribose 2'-O-methyltransferase Hen1